MHDKTVQFCIMKRASQKPKYFSLDKDTNEALTLLATSLDVDGGILTMKSNRIRLPNVATLRYSSFRCRRFNTPAHVRGHRVPFNFFTILKFDIISIERKTILFTEHNIFLYERSRLKIVAFVL